MTKRYLPWFHLSIMLVLLHVPFFSKAESDSLNRNSFVSIFDIAKQSLTNRDSALYYCDLAMEYAKSDGDLKEMSDVYNLMGVIYFQNSENAKADSLYRRSLSLLNPEKHAKEWASNISNIALVHMSSGVYDSAIYYYDSAYAMRKQLNNLVGMAGVEVNLGVIHYYKGNFELSINHFIASARLSESVGDSAGMSGSLNNIGNIYMELKDFSKAIPYLEQSLKIDEKLDAQGDFSYAYGNLATAGLNSNDNPKALEYFNLSAENAKKHNNKTNLAEAYDGLGKTYSALGNRVKAIEFFKSAIHLNESINNQYALANNYVSLSGLYLKDVNSPDLAISYAKKAFTIAVQLGARATKAEALHNLYFSYKKTGNEKAALDYFEQYVQLNDSIFGEEKFRQINELESKYQNEKKTQEIEILQKDNKLKELEIEEQGQRVKAQRRLIILVLLGLVLLVSTAIVWYQLYKNKQITLRNQLEIKSLKNEQKLLRSQMNPHFIYNSLNSIQSFISSDNSYEAEKYLARFARLMRGILENSRCDFVSLEKELEVLKLYMELEQLRFENRFTFRMIRDENLEEEYITIPPMIIQPFIENAILHGFRGVNNGELMVSFSDNGEQLECIIDDNGIGREKAAEFAGERKHQSLATTITKERLQSLAAQFNKSAGFETIDKICPETGNSLGTQVIIQIPYQES